MGKHIIIPEEIKNKKIENIVLVTDKFLEYIDKLKAFFPNANIYVR